jgi:CheY-like chemotaxis protein
MAYTMCFVLFCFMAVADNGQEALDSIHQSRPPSEGQALTARPYDVVFMDLEMPSKPRCPVIISPYS